MSDSETENQRQSTAKSGNVDIGRIVTVVLIFALIAALISLVVPPNVHGRSREARAYSEIKGCELALTKVLSDAGVSDLRDLFTDPNALDGATAEETIKWHTDAVYALLRDGKNASLDLRPEERNRLGSSYMYLDADPWGEHRYVFYMPHGDGDEMNALDRRFIDTYMTYNVIGGETRPWQSDVPMFIACRGKDGRLELFDSAGSTNNDIGDDFSNLRDPSAPEKIEILGESSPSR